MAFQSVYFFADFSIVSDHILDKKSLITFEKQIDSLKHLADSKSKIFPFNPNYLSDSRGYSLGMSVEEIDRLLAHRASNHYINSTKEFQQITKISDTLLKQISPYFKFPIPLNKKTGNPLKKQKEGINKPKQVKKDINTATALELQKIKGIGLKLSDRIVKYRSFLKGYSFEEQLSEVYGLNDEIVKRILYQFEIQEKPIIKKVNINTASYYELRKIPYVSAQLAKKIITYRSKFGEIKSIKEIITISNLSSERIDRIELYLNYN